MDGLLTVDLPQSMASASSEASGRHHHRRNGQHHFLKKVEGHQFYYNTLTVREAVVATCLVSLRIETQYRSASFTVYLYEQERRFLT